MSGFKFTKKVKKYSVVPGGIILRKYSRVEITAYDISNLSDKSVQMVKDKVLVAFNFQSQYTKAGDGMCMSKIGIKYLTELLDKRSLRYIILANVNITLGQYPIGFVILTSFEASVAIELDLICTMNFEKNTKTDRAKAMMELMCEFKGKTSSDEFTSEYKKINLIRSRLRFGLGVIMICETLQFIKDNGVKYVTLEAADVNLIPYYTRFAFVLADRYCGQKMPKQLEEDIRRVVCLNSMDKLEEFLNENLDLFYTKSGSWRMRLCNINHGIELACEWASLYLEKGAPSGMWSQTIKQGINRFVTPRVLFVEVRNKQYYIFNVPDNASVLFFIRDRIYTIHTVNPMPSYPLYIQDSKGKTYFGPLTDGKLEIDTNKLPENFKESLYGVTPKYPEMKFKISFIRVFY